MKNTSQYILKYGVPTHNGTGYLTQIDLPFPMRIAWDKKTLVKKLHAIKQLPNL